MSFPWCLCFKKKFFFYAFIHPLVVHCCYLIQGVSRHWGNSLLFWFSLIFRQYFVPASQGRDHLSDASPLSNGLGPMSVSAPTPIVREYCLFTSPNYMDCSLCLKRDGVFFPISPREWGFWSIGNIRGKDAGRSLCPSSRDAVPLPILGPSWHFLFTLILCEDIQWGLWRRVWQWMWFLVVWDAQEPYVVTVAHVLPSACW